MSNESKILIAGLDFYIRLILIFTVYLILITCTKQKVVTNSPKGTINLYLHKVRSHIPCFYIYLNCEIAHEK